MKAKYTSYHTFEEFVTSPGKTTFTVASNCNSIAFFPDITNDAVLDGVYPLNGGDSLFTLSNDPDVIDEKDYQLRFILPVPNGAKVIVVRKFIERIC